MTAPLDHEHKEIDYKKLIESDLSNIQFKEREWYINRITPDVNIEMNVSEGYTFTSSKHPSGKM